MTQQVTFKAINLNDPHPHYYSVVAGLQCLTIINPQRTLTHANGCEASLSQSHNYPYLILSNGHPGHGSAIVDLIADRNLFADICMPRHLANQRVELSLCSNISVSISC